MPAIGPSSCPGTAAEFWVKESGESASLFLWFFVDDDDDDVVAVVVVLAFLLDLLS